MMTRGNLHLLTSYVSKVSGVLVQILVGAKSNEYRAALHLLGILVPLQDRLVTADAVFKLRDFSQRVLDAGSH